MSTKKQVVELVRERLADVAGRGRVLGQALKVRADMAATRRRLRATFTELGEEVYSRLKAGEMVADDQLSGLRERIDGLKAEVKSREAELRQIMQGGFRPETPGEDDETTVQSAGEGDPQH